MARHVMLNNVDHHDLRVITRHGAEFGDNVASVPVVPTEFEDLQREYPIFFRKDPKTDQYISVALLGFAKNENLFLQHGRWNAHYIPGFIARGPFLIGLQQRENPGAADAPRAVVNVDLDDPRISRTEGEPLFLPQGGNSRYLEKIATILDGMNRGLDASPAMFDAFMRADLIESIKVEIRFDSREQCNLVGLHTINQQRLASLDAGTLHSLHRPGFLQGAFLVAASVRNLQRLINLKHEQHQRQTAVAS